MKTNPVPKAKLKSLTPDILNAWREDKLARFLAGTLRNMIQQGLLPESIFPTMCPAIRSWLEVHLKSKNSTSVFDPESNQMVVSLFIEVMMLVRSNDLGEAQ
jgi:hypothetical protein